ncbi:MAG: alpha-D-ribose 1-methylphosphonate 5-triphosphate diphosphatase [Cellvibrionaceae bacterium]|jgi:alpha-D-ribose 1-methylphosphonate 5-triphosphate diphosphatase
MNEQIYTNAQLVLADSMFVGTLVVRDGVIAEIDTKVSASPTAIDINKDYLIPGLIELHTDNLEKHFTPRPKVTWPGQPAVIAHDAQLVAAGITTVFDAIALGDVDENSQRLANLQAMLSAIKTAQNKNLLRAEHFLHLRCELCHKDVLNIFEGLIDDSAVHLVSVMDHSPGQRQFMDMDKYRVYYQGKYGLSDQQLEEFIVRQSANSQQFSDKHRQAVVAMCQQRGIPLASHDDATYEHIEESSNFGMTIAEFPTTKIAAVESHKRGMNVLMGAPNLVRGGSHSGNIAAHELAHTGVLDILSSDYYPASMLHAAFILEGLDNDYDLPKAIRTVTKNPAAATKLNDRGELAIGMRADLVQVNDDDEFPLVRQVWQQGVRVF